MRIIPFSSYPTWHAFQGDGLRTLLPDQCVDFVCGSPPYSLARTYGIDFALDGQDWVDWMVAGFREWLRISRGAVAMVLEGQTKNFRYSCTPALLMADLHRAGITLRKPMIYHRIGIPGSGGPDYLRNDYEFILFATNGGRLPWSCNTAMGHAPKYETGGRASNRTRDGRRANEKRYGAITKAGNNRGYAKPKIANPGNIIRCTVGGGQMGHSLAAENEAPYPLSLPNHLIRTFCPLWGTVFDPFCGSGTTLQAAIEAGRDAIGMDVRASQIELTTRRLTDVSQRMFGRAA